MLVITGAAGFIGSYLLGRLNREAISDIIIVDDFSRPDKIHNLEGKKFARQLHRDEFTSWMAENPGKVSFVFHIGARTDTTAQDIPLFDRLNTGYSKSLWNLCTQQSVPLVYASSAATYGAGEFGYSDDMAMIPKLKPLNPYGWSKQHFDLWVLEQKETPPYWAGLKFFNVYGPNEYHKGRMASVNFHASNQIIANGKVKLFRSHRPDFHDGWQLRDFIYVKDVAEVCLFLFRNKAESSIYNLGTGKARSFYDLAVSTFNAMKREAVIEYIDIPEDIRETYQYFTEARMEKLQAQGYTQPFTSLEDGVQDYVANYLSSGRYF